MDQGINRRGFLKAAAMGATALAAPGWLRAAVASDRKPNIIFILADDMGYGDVGCYNPGSKIPTPNMDRLAQQGIRFTDAHSPSSVCTPTRYGILTGRYCWRSRLKSGVLLGYDKPLIEPGRLIVASLLKRHGYATAAFGKWHLGLDLPRKNESKPAAAGNVDYTKPIKGGPRDLGFDYFFGIAASLDMPPYIYIENDRTIGLPTAQGSAQDYLRAGEREPDFHAVDVLPKLTSKATQYIRDHAKANGDQPMFMYVALTAPHTPVAPADFVKGRSKAGEYGDFVAEVDWTVGEIMKALDETRLAENTLLILTSDNGSTNKVLTRFGHKPNGELRGRKSDIWDGGHREPFIARWPARIKPGSVSDQTICLVDLLATSAAIVGADLPKNAGEDSFNILPALLGQKLSPPRPPIIHHSIDGMFAIRQGKWKLVLGRGSGGWDGKGAKDDPPGQLYDMQADPKEQTNLYTSEPATVQRLTELLDACKRAGRSRGL